MRHLRETREGAVDPDVERGVHAVNVQEHLALVPALGQREGAAIAADGVVVGHIGRIEGNGIVDVGVVRLIIAVHLPVGGHGKLVPALVGIVVVDFLEALGRAADGGIEEIPAAVEQAIAAGQAALAGQSVLFGQIGDQAGARFLAANLQHVGVLPVGQRLIHEKQPPCSILRSCLSYHTLPENCNRISAPHGFVMRRAESFYMLFYLTSLTRETQAA